MHFYDINTHIVNHCQRFYECGYVRWNDHQSLSQMAVNDDMSYLFLSLANEHLNKLPLNVFQRRFRLKNYEE